VFFDGERVARRDGATGTGGVFYYFSDHLKTASVITDSAGVIKAESDYYPWGGELKFVDNDSNDYKFTGKKRDLETGLDYFGARYYSNGLGRWVSADWSSTPVPVPYADFDDPQSLNLYTYVRGLPTTRIDADGHCCNWKAAWDFGTGVVRGVVSSASFGAVGAPKSTDSTASLAGQALGTVIEGSAGTMMRNAGAAEVVGGLAAELPSGGTSTVVVVAGAAQVLVGSTAEAGAAKNTMVLAKALADKAGTQESSKAHGNTAGDQPAELYEKHDANGNFEKHGVSQDASKRYTKKEVNGGTVKVTDRGPRKEMLKKERHNVETNPGPKNKEPWAGKKQDQ
jgi:RHS repeat-associated protein